MGEVIETGEFHSGFSSGIFFLCSFLVDAWVFIEGTERVFGAKASFA